MANRQDRTTHQKRPDVVIHSDGPTCSRSTCEAEAVNTVKMTDAQTGEDFLQHRCREHTSRFDRLVAGPGYVR